jgi:hypothetical protein
LEPDQLLIDGLLIQEAANDLKTPENISIFIKLLCSEKRNLQLSSVYDLIKDATDKQRTIRRWYLALASREQLLAIGLSFFDGLFEDQFFAAIDRVVERVWQIRDPSLRALDYRDLDELKYFFDFVPSEEGYGIKIESRISEQRRMLFEIAWNSHRRQILTALPILSQLAVNSVAQRSNDIELYGTPIRRGQLRIVISEALSDIGLISISAVQHSLLQLASDDELGVQVVAARAIARWRQYKRDDALFSILNDWQERAGRHGNSRDNIRATVAVAISYASFYDSSNKLNEELCRMLKLLAKDRSIIVRNRFCTHTLPYVIPRHLVKLRESLEEMTQEIDLIPEIAKSLANSYRYNDEGVIETLAEWEKRCRSLQSSQGNSTEITQREKLLATVALTYGYIKYDNVVSKLTAEKAFRWMQNTLNEERSSFVHKWVVFAISHQASRNFEKVEPLLKNLLSNITEVDSDEIVQLLTDIYLEQRREMGKGEDVININGLNYPIWIDSKRPPTDVETAMQKWVLSQDNPASQQIAVRALVSFAKSLDIKEQQQIQQIIEQRKTLMVQPEPDRSAIASMAIATKIATPLEKLVSFCATFGKTPYYAILQGLLPEILSQNKRNKPLMDFVLEKWQKATNSELNMIFINQEHAIWLIEHQTFLIAVPFAGIAVLILVREAMQSGIIFLMFFGILIILSLTLYKKHYGRLPQQEMIGSISYEKVAQLLKDNLKR